jgi:hypothetical protein
VVTLAGYYVHSTLVPAIVPILFFAPGECISVMENVLSNDRGGRWKEGNVNEVHDRSKFGIQRCVRSFLFLKSPAPTPILTTSLSLCLPVGFFGLDLLVKLIQIDLPLLPRSRVSATSHF